jgi:hypothetical protein
MITTGKNVEKTESVCDTLDMKKNLFYEKELVKVLKGLKNNKAPGADNVVNEHFEYSGLG